MRSSGASIVFQHFRSGLRYCVSLVTLRSGDRPDSAVLAPIGRGLELDALARTWEDASVAAMSC